MTNHTERARTKSEALTEHVARALADAPPLSDAQRGRIAAILLNAQPRFTVSQPVRIEVKP